MIRLLHGLLLLAGAAASSWAAVIPYQGTLRQSGALFSGNATFVFRLTSADGSTEYWTSGSTVVAVNQGLFRYPLGEPNQATFSGIDWTSVSPFVEVTVNGTLLTPREALGSSPFALHTVGGARLASTQTFSGQNFFSNAVLVSSDATVAGALNRGSNLSVGSGGYSVTFASAVKAGWFYGDGAGLTNVQAAPATTVVASGVLPGNLSAGVTITPGGVNLSTVTAALAGKQAADADLDDLADGELSGSKVGAGVPAANIAAGTLGAGVLISASGVDLSTVTTALAGKLDVAGVPPGLVDLSTVATALAGKLSTAAGIAPGLVDLSTVTTALAGKLAATANVPSGQIDLSTVTAALAGKLDVAGVPPGLVDFSTVTTALAGKLSTTAGIAPGLVDLSTVTTALAGKLSTTAGIAPGLVDLSTVTTALAGKLSTTAGIAPGLVDLSTVTSALAGKLAKGGDGMSGPLTLSGSTLTVTGEEFSVGTATLAVRGGRVGVRTATPTDALDVDGTIRTKASVANSAATIDWSLGNLQHLTLACQALTFTNMRDGGSYSLVVKGATSGTCSFTQGGLTFHMPSDHGATTASGAQHTVYTFLVSGGDAYVSWITGL